MVCMYVCMYIYIRVYIHHYIWIVDCIKTHVFHGRPKKTSSRWRLHQLLDICLEHSGAGRGEKGLNAPHVGSLSSKYHKILGWLDYDDLGWFDDMVMIRRLFTVYRWFGNIWDDAVMIFDLHWPTNDNNRSASQTKRTNDFLKRRGREGGRLPSCRHGRPKKCAQTRPFFVSFETAWVAYLGRNSQSFWAWRWRTGTSILWHLCATLKFDEYLLSVFGSWFGQ